MTIRPHTIVPRLVSEFGYPEKDAETVVQDVQACAPVVQAAFERWWQGEGFDEQLQAQGYTLQRLIDEHGLEPIGAFLTIDWLIREPDTALQALSQGHDYVLVSPEVRTAYEQAKERGRYAALVERVRACFGAALLPLSSPLLDHFALPEETKAFLRTVGLPGAGAESLLIHLYADPAEVLEVHTYHQEHYLIIGNDYGTKLAIQEHTGEILSLDVHGTLPARFVNATVLTFLACVATYVNEQPTLARATDVEATIMVARLTEQLRRLDAQALADAENWWSVFLEQRL